MGLRPHRKIVLYHGVTSERSGGIFNYRGKFITPAAFAKQLAYLKRHYTVLPLAEFISKRESDTLPRNALAITFDDGYANNYVHAFPLLRNAGLPATFFITTGFIEGTPLGVDIIEYAIGNTKQESLTLQLGSGVQTLPLGTRQERIAADLTLRTYFKTLSPKEAAEFLKEVVTKTGCDLAPTLESSPYRPLTWEQMQEMEQRGMTFAPHTVTHPILSRASAAEARAEIARSHQTLKEHDLKPLTVFAYPNGGKGDYTAETVSILKENNFIAALTTEPSSITNKHTMFALPRYTLDGTNALYHFKLVISGAYQKLYDNALWAIMLLAAALRIAGIWYGLPLWLVGDEPPFVLGTLQMIQLKTLLPILHPQAFAGILYFPPYLCYIYLLPFIATLGVQYMLWHGAAPFASIVLANLTPYFIIARLFTIVLGTASVYLLYQISLAFFNSRKAALASAFLLATSITHIGLSVAARHWMPTSFIFLLVLFFVTRDYITERKRYFIALIIAGVGAGIDTTAVLSLIPAFFWYLAQDKTPLLLLLRDRLIQIGIALFVFLAILPTFLYPGGNGFVAGVSLFSTKSLFAFIASPLSILSFTLFSEPVLTGLFLIGVCLLLWERRRVGLWALGFFLTYIAIFYVVFNLMPRFFLPLIPLYALVGGYAFMRLQKINTLLAIALWIVLLIPLASSLRFSQLLFLGDTRSMARTSLLQNLSPQDKIIVYADLTRLPATPAAVDELRTIDASAVRKIDEADAALNLSTLPHALNLYTVSNDAFFAGLPTYAKAHGYTYLLYQPGYESDHNPRQAAFATLIGTQKPAQVWSGSGNGLSITGSAFTAPFYTLFTSSSLGPEIDLYRLQ